MGMYDNPSAMCAERVIIGQQLRDSREQNATDRVHHSVMDTFVRIVESVEFIAMQDELASRAMEEVRIAEDDRADD